MTTYTLFGSTTPSVITDVDSSPLTLGTVFQSDTDGVINGVRFYKSATNTGTHIGALWTDTGLLLKSVTFTGESASGWQEMLFDSPVPINAGYNYLVGVYMPNGHFSKDASFFGSAFVNAPLTAPASGDVSGNGRYDTTAALTFPPNSVDNSNYWVDVIFEITSPPTEQFTLLDDATPSTVDGGDGSEVNVALIFEAVNSGYILGIRFYKADANTGTHIAFLRQMDGTQLATVTFTDETANGWQEMLFDTPIAVDLYTQYMASVYMPVGHYSKDVEFFGSQYYNYPLIGVSNSVVTTGHGNGEYAYGDSSTIPNASFQNTSYLIDILFAFALSEPPSGIVPVLDSLSRRRVG